MLTIGCSGSGSGSTPAATASASASAAGPFVPNSDGPGRGPGSDFQYGGTATFTPNSIGVLEEYAGHYVNSPQNFVVNLNLVPFSYGKGTVYGGVVTMAYQDTINGSVVSYIDYFTSGNSGQSSQYNVVYNANGGTVYHGFFTDNYGGLVAVINPTSGGLGDGGGSVSGSIWFLNPQIQYGDGPPAPTYCWFISLGPYDCQSWADGNGNINTYQAVNPNQGYVQLGTFTGLNVSQAFNGAF
jgi:hypothetical protein